MNSDYAHIMFLPRWYPNRYDPMPGLFIRNHAVAVVKAEDGTRKKEDGEWKTEDGRRKTENGKGRLEEGRERGNLRLSVLYLHGCQELDGKFEIEERYDASVYTIRVYYRSYNGKLPLAGNLIKFRRFLRAFSIGYKRILFQYGKPDIIHVHVLTRHGVLALWKKWWAGIPYIISEHWSRYLPYVNTYRGLLRKIVTRLVVKNAKAVTTPTENLRKAMERFGLQSRCFVLLPNVVDTERFKPLLEKGISAKMGSESGSSRKKFIHVSCFEDRSKNISGIIRAVQQLSVKRDDFECIMAGEGMDLEYLTALAEKLAIKDKYIFFSGLLEGEDLVNDINSSGFLVLFSNYENLPVVINEAFACGKPVIATDVGGISEVLSNERGVMIPKNDETALAESLDYMLDHYTSFNSKQIRAYAVRNFSEETVGNLLVDLYSDILDLNEEVS